MATFLSSRFTDFWTDTKNRLVGWLTDPSDSELRVLKLREFHQNLALSYFEGNQPRILKVDPKSNIDDNLFIPYAEMIVD